MVLVVQMHPTPPTKKNRNINNYNNNNNCGPVAATIHLIGWLGLTDKIDIMALSNTFWVTDQINCSITKGDPNQ